MGYFRKSCKTLNVVLGWRALVRDVFFIRKVNMTRGGVVTELDLLVDEDGGNGVEGGLKDHKDLERFEVKNVKNK